MKIRSLVVAFVLVVVATSAFGGLTGARASAASIPTFGWEEGFFGHLVTGDERCDANRKIVLYKSEDGAAAGLGTEIATTTTAHDGVGTKAGDWSIALGPERKDPRIYAYAVALPTAVCPAVRAEHSILNMTTDRERSCGPESHAQECHFKFVLPESGCEFSTPSCFGLLPGPGLCVQEMRWAIGGTSEWAFRPTRSGCEKGRPLIMEGSVPVLGVLEPTIYSSTVSDKFNYVSVAPLHRTLPRRNAASPLVVDALEGSGGRPGPTLIEGWLARAEPR